MSYRLVFLSYAGVIIVGSIATAYWAGPRWGKKNMLVYISICSWIGGLSVVSTEGIGSAILAQIGGTMQVNQWFFWVLLVFVISTLVTEIIFLNVSPVQLHAAHCLRATSDILLTESPQFVQCGIGHPDLLRILHNYYDHHRGHTLPWLPWHGHSYHYRCQWFPHYLRWCCAATAF